MKTKNASIPYCSVQAVYLMGFAVYGAFSSYYLLEAGLSNSMIGLVLSMSALVSALLQPLIGGFIDRSVRIGNRPVISSLCFVMSFLSVIMYLLADGSLLLITLVFALNYMISQLCYTFLSALAIEYLNQGYPISFGIARACGSVGYGGFAFIMGLITIRFGAKSVPAAAGIANLIVALILLFFMPRPDSAAARSVENAEGKKEAASSAVSGPFDFIRSYPAFMITLLGFILVYFSHVLVNTYALQILETKGGNSAHVGTAAAIAAGFEIIPMIIFPLIRKHFSLSSLLRISAVFFTLKVAGSLLAPGIISYMAVQILQFGGWGIAAVAIVYYANEVVDHENASQAQAYAGVSYTLANVIGTAICGRLMDMSGIGTTLIVATIISALGCAVVFFSTRKK